MSPQPNRFFRLSMPAGKSGVSCDSNGAFIDDVPLLKSSKADAHCVWVTRCYKELSDEISSRYGLPIDLSSRAGGLEAIARALNSGDLALAQIATVQLAFPEPPSLSKGSQSSQAREQFIRELYWSGLIKADWNPGEHPRWPAGSPESQGGQFAPKDEALPDTFQAGHDSNSFDDPLPDGRAGNGNAESEASLIDATFDGSADTAAVIPAVESGDDEGMFDPVVYRGYFHDEVVQGLARDYRNHGYKVETEIPLEMADGSGATRIDLLIEGPSKIVCGIEVKTGDDPFFTRAQLYVYPHLIMGGSVITANTRIGTFSLPPMTPLPPIPILLFRVKDSNSKQVLDWLSPQKLLQEFDRRFGAGKTRKFESQLLSKKGTSEMIGDEDPSIIAHNFMGTEFGSCEMALAMAKMLITNHYDEEFLKTQLPLQAIDGGDRWIIEGSRKGEDYPAGPDGLHDDKFVVEIRKRNCQVLKFAGTAW